MAQKQQKKVAKLAVVEEPVLLAAGSAAASSSTPQPKASSLAIPKAAVTAASSALMASKPVRKAKAKKSSTTAVALTQSQREWQKKTAAPLAEFLWGMTISQLKKMMELHKIPSAGVTDKDSAVQTLYTQLKGQEEISDTEGDPEEPDARRYAERVVKQRVHQPEFRGKVLLAYENRCAVCRLRHPELLDAAHILPDSHPLGKPVVTNGLSLCKIHHGAYDSNFLGIDPDYQVHINAELLLEKDGPMLKHGLQEMHGLALQLPKVRAKRPSRDNLAERFDLFSRAS